MVQRGEGIGERPDECVGHGRTDSNSTGCLFQGVPLLQQWGVSGQLLLTEEVHTRHAGSGVWEKMGCCLLAD